MQEEIPETTKPARSGLCGAFRRHLETTRNIEMAHPAGFEPTTPPSEGNAVQIFRLAAKVQKCL